MGRSSNGKKQERTSSMETTGKLLVFMGTEMRFRSKQCAEAFETKITEEARQRVWAYYKCKGRAIDAVRLLGLKGSTKVFTNRLSEIARQLGANSARELFLPPKVATSQLTSSFLAQLIKKQEYRCALSGVTLTPDTAALDHILPYSEGGKHTRDNVQWVHEEVNRMKGQMGSREFKEWCRRVAGWTG
jgi:5-methylcytosine-specific restriction endonuclease McrA